MATAMQKCKVGPKLMNIVKLVPLNDLFHAELQPCGNANDKTNIPIGCILYNLFQFLCPVFFFSDLFSWFIKSQA
jgi:hypothetical protein